MNPAVLFATFALVIPAELPDKTFISCIIMASRHRPLPVWIGGASALVLQAGIAVVAGRLLILLPRTAVRGVVAALFLGGALYLLLVPEKKAEEAGSELAEKDAAEPPSTTRAFLRPMLTTFSIVALAEFGDVTQVLIADLAAHFRQPWPVFVGASLGFLVVSALGVLGGRSIVRIVPLAVVRRLSGVALLGLGIYSLVSLL